MRRSKLLCSSSTCTFLLAKMIDSNQFLGRKAPDHGVRTRPRAGIAGEKPWNKSFTTPQTEMHSAGIAPVAWPRSPNFGCVSDLISPSCAGGLAISGLSGEPVQAFAWLTLLANGSIRNPDLGLLFAIPSVNPWQSIPCFCHTPGKLGELFRKRLKPH